MFFFSPFFFANVVVPLHRPHLAPRPRRPATDTDVLCVVFRITILHCGGGLVLNSMCQLVALGTIGLLCLCGEDEKWCLLECGADEGGCRLPV